MLTLVLTLTRVQGDEHILTNKKRVYGPLTNERRVSYLDIRAEAVDHVLEDVGGVGLTVVIPTELRDQTRLGNQPIRREYIDQ